MIGRICRDDMFTAHIKHFKASTMLYRSHLHKCDVWCASLNTIASTFLLNKWQPPPPFVTYKTRYVTFRSKGRLFKVQYRVFKTKLGTLGCWPPPLLFRTWSLQKSFLSPFLWKSDYDSEQLASKFRDQMRPVHWCLMISMLASPRELIKCLHEIGSFKIAQLLLTHLFPSH